MMTKIPRDKTKQRKLFMKTYYYYVLNLSAQCVGPRGRKAKSFGEAECLLSFFSEIRIFELFAPHGSFFAVPADVQKLC
mgnify:CR=1 FL=1